MEYLFRNRLFRAIVALMILAFIAGTATRLVTGAPPAASVTSGDPVAAPAQVMIYGPASERGPSDAETQRRDESPVSTPSYGSIATIEVRSAPDVTPAQTAKLDPPPQ